MKISVNISVNPESDEERKANPEAYENISYTLSGYKTGMSLNELNDKIYSWLKSQRKE